MIPNLQKILKEWSYRVGVIKPNDEAHLFQLQTILTNEGWPLGVINEFIENLNELAFDTKSVEKIYKDDSLLDLHIRIQSLEQKLMINAINLIKYEKINSNIQLSKGNYYKSVPEHIEKNLKIKFKEYKNRYGE